MAKITGLFNMVVHSFFTLFRRRRHMARVEIEYCAS
jgi:hypothetical protein